MTAELMNAPAAHPLPAHRAGEERGSLLLDSLVGISIVAIVFSIIAPNYARATVQTKVATDAQQLQNIGTALELYANDNAGTFPASSGGAFPPSGINFTNYMAGTPVSAYNPSVGFTYTSPSSNGAGYTVADGATMDPTLLGSYRTINGTPCTTCTGLYYDNVHGVYGG